MTINSLKPVRPKGYWFYHTVWEFFGNRRYDRNTSNDTEIFRSMLTLSFSVLAILFFEFFPFRIIASMVLIVFMFFAMFRPVSYANQTPWFGVVNIIIGATGLLTHWQFGLTVLGYHIENIVFIGFLEGGALTLLRRGWNFLIWKLLDKSGRNGVLR